jgi:hypothetical protein
MTSHGSDEHASDRPLPRLKPVMTEPPYDDESSPARPVSPSSPPGPHTIQGSALRRRAAPGSSPSRGRGARDATDPRRTRPVAVGGAVNARTGRAEHALPAPSRRPAGESAAPAAPARAPAPDRRLDEDPRATAAIVVRAVVEVLARRRPTSHLAGWATPAALVRLERLAGAHPGPGTVRSLRVSEPRPGVAELVAVVDHADRVSALAARLELRGGRWQLTTVQHV